MPAPLALSILISASVTLSAALAFSAPASAESARIPRNVVFVLADDLGYGELGSYGQEKIRTPHLDKLAAEGARLTMHYSGAPVCAPARCVLMTGKHLGRAEIRGNRQASMSFPEFTEGQHPISADAVTMARVFRDAGFATGAMGKWGLGPVGSSGDPDAQGFDHFFGYNCQAVAHSFYPRFLWRNDEKIEINPKPGPWEVYDLAKDPAETNNLASETSELIRRSVEILTRETAENSLFPLAIPGAGP